MRRLGTLVLVALICVAAPSVARAQTAGDSTAHPKALHIDRWINHPAAITLSVDQRKQFDSIRAKYAAESQKIAEQSRSVAPMETMVQMRGMTHKYQSMVRAILTPSQQAAFDANIKADVIGR